MKNAGRPSSSWMAMMDAGVSIPDTASPLRAIILFWIHHLPNDADSVESEGDRTEI